MLAHSTLHVPIRDPKRLSESSLENDLIASWWIKFYHLYSYHTHHNGSFVKILLMLPPFSSPPFQTRSQALQSSSSFSPVLRLSISLGSPVLFYISYLIDFAFLDASTHLYKRLCSSVGLSVGPSVGPSRVSQYCEFR